MSFGDIGAAVEQFRYRVEKQDGYAAQVMVQMYQPAYQRLVAQGDLLAQKIAQAKANGEPLGQSWLFQQDRIQSLKRAVGKEVRDFAKQADGWLGGTGLQQFVNMATQDAKALATMQGLRGTWTDLNTDAITAIIGAGQGRSSPLRQLFSTLGVGVEDDLTAVLSTAIATGMGPDQTAREIRRVVSTPLTRAKTIARTEQLRAYREASRQSYLRNHELLSGWIWYSGRDRRTCVACWAMHGTRHDVGERMSAHVNCRCTMIPDVDGSLYIEPGPDAFRKLSEADQRAILGPGKYDLYASGKADIQHMIHEDHSAAWGTSIREGSIRDARLAAGKPSNPAFWNYQPKPVAQGIKDALQHEAELARARVVQLGAEMDKAAAALWNELEDLGRQHAAQWDIIRDVLTSSPRERQAASLRAGEITHQRALVMAQYLEVKDKYVRLMRESLVVDSPSKVKIVIEDVNGRVLAKHKKAWREGADWFGRLTTRQVAEDAPFRYTPGAKGSMTGRSFQAGGRVYMAKRDDVVATVVHELGHWLEHHDKGASDAAQRFLRRRTVGEANTKLRDVFPKHNYGVDEVTKLDKFIHPYMGKDYGFTASEITSMGLQMFYEDAATLARDDPDMFDFIYRMVRGGS